MAELTKQGYDLILDRILNHKVSYPAPMVARDMQIWVDGYSDCLAEVCKIIEELRDECGR